MRNEKFLPAKIILLWLILGAAAFGQKAELVIETGSNGVGSVAFSPDGKILAGGSLTDIKLWNATTGQELRTLAGASNPVFSSDGKTLSSIIVGGGIKLWNWQTGEELRTIQTYVAAKTVPFSPDGEFIASSNFPANTIKIWNTQTGQEVRTLAGHTNIISSLAFSPDGKTLVSCSLDNTLKLWNWKTGEILKTIQSNAVGTNTVAFSPKGDMLAATALGNDGLVTLWDVATGQVIKTFGTPYQSLISLVFSPNGNILASVVYRLNVTKSGMESIIQLFDTRTGQELQTINSTEFSYTESSTFAAFSSDGATLASGGAKNPKLWEVRTGKEISKFTGNTSQITSAGLSQDENLLASGHLDGTIRLWNLQKGELFKTLKGDSSYSESIAFSTDDKILASSDADKTIKLWNTETGEQLKSLPVKEPTTQAQVEALVPDFYREKQLMISMSGGKFSIFPGYGSNISNSLTIHEGNNPSPLVSLISLNQKDWVIITPDGLFDASPDARKSMHYIIGIEPIALEQMKDVYYVPGLLQKILKGESLPKVELFSGRDLFPLAEYAPFAPNQKQLAVKLTNRGGGIGQIQILVNGKEFVRDARPANFDSNQKTANLIINLADAPFLIGRENKIEIVTRNAVGSINSRGSSRGAEIVQQFDYGAKTAAPQIYAIIGGISDYTGDNLQLKYAAKDAEDFAQALEVGADKLFGADKVHLRLLTSSGDQAGIKFNAPDAKISTATKADFQQAFADFKNATPNDIFIVYLAGHGVSLNLNQNPNQPGGDTYLYLTQEATTTDKSVLGLENSRRAMSVSSEELKDLMKQNKALKQVLILDTCASGQAAESFVQKRDLSSDQIRAIERLKDNTGFYILMGSAADAVSYEASQYGQGLLTYSLLQGMKGAKLRENQFADVSLLFDYAQITVPQMAKNIGGIQQPRIITPDTSRSFDIGQFTQIEQKQIPLSNPKPIFLTPTLFNPAANRDNLKLSKIMAEQLRSLNYVKRRGANSPIVYVETDEMADGIQPSGSYTVEGDTLKISVILVKNNQPIGKEIVVTGKAGEAENLIKQIVEAMTRVSEI